VKRSLTLGYVPLVDAAGLIAAQSQGFFADEGLEVTLSREASWATIRDKVAVGALDGAHVLAPMVIAQTLGVGSDATPMIAPVTLACDASAITLSRRLGLDDARPAAALAERVAARRTMDASPLTFSSVFPYSTHNYLLRLWLSEAGVDPDRDVRLTIAPPPRMPELLASGIIEGFCAGEPWNSVAVAAGSGVLAARACDIAPGAPDKVLGLTEAWSRRHPETLAALIRAVVRGLRWTADPDHHDQLAEVLSQPHCLGVPRAMVAGGLAIARFDEGRPTHDQAAWLLDQMRRWGQVQGPGPDAEAVYRPDLFDQAWAKA
jgi:NitT/TauT family transport system ATP-binding protein/nitrate/nitrite transport system substrate-binding protein